MQKIEKIVIAKGDNKTIGDNFSIDIKPYTVLIGENNSGKTNLVNAFYNQENKNFNIFYFPATDIELEKSDQASTGKKTSPFYKLLAEILKNEKVNLDESIVEPLNTKLEEITKKINENIKFVKNKETILRVTDKLSEETVIKNLILFKVLDKHWIGGKEVGPEEVGQGTQRMIIFSLLKYYSENNFKNEKLNFFIIEEPEIYLHPRIKREFNKILSAISKKDKNQVLVTTHDPYFVEMNVSEADDKSIIAIERSEETGLTERIVINKVNLPDMSYSKINYEVFGICTNSFHNELYGYIQENAEKYSEDEMDAYFLSKKLKISKKWTREKEGVAQEEKTVTLQTFIRNKIHHPENKKMKDDIFTDEELKKSIEEMVSLLNSTKK